MECGTDIIEISRVREAIDKYGESFSDKVFTTAERQYCESHNAAKYQHYAARFSGKEAVAKLLGTGFNGIEWKEIEIINDESGKPQVFLHGGAAEFFEKSGYEKITISLSHCKEYASSVAIGY